MYYSSVLGITGRYMCWRKSTPLAEDCTFCLFACYYYYYYYHYYYYYMAGG